MASIATMGADHNSPTLGASGAVPSSSSSCFTARIPEAAIEPVINRYFHYWLSSHDDDGDAAAFADSTAAIAGEDDDNDDHRSGSMSSFSLERLQKTLLQSALQGDEASVVMILLQASRMRRTSTTENGQSSSQSSTNICALLQFQDAQHSHTALHVAANAGHISIVQLFLDLDKNTIGTNHSGSGEDAEEENIAMHHPHSYAREQQQARQSRHLVMIEDHLGRLALHFAILNRQEAVVNVLLQHIQHYCSPLERHEILHGKPLGIVLTPLTLAAHLGLNATIVQLLQMNRNERGETIKFLSQEMNHSCSPPLIMAVRARHESTVQLLLDHGASVNVTDIENEHQEAADTSTLTTTARTTRRRRQERSALHCAVDSGMESMVHVLLKHGANVTATRSPGRTALHDAIQSGYDSI
jgi:ankyrin repeat protein